MREEDQLSGEEPKGGVVVSARLELRPHDTLVDQRQINGTID
jgi:hypothetical protein